MARVNLSCHFQILDLTLSTPSHVVSYELHTSHGEDKLYNLRPDPTAWEFGILRGSTFELLR